MKIVGFGIANYRSFDADGVWITDFDKINVLIGRNNCGKSNVLRFLRLIAKSRGGSNFSLDSSMDKHSSNNEQHTETNDPTYLGLSVLFEDEVPEGKLERELDIRNPVIDIWIDPNKRQAINPNPLGNANSKTLITLADVLFKGRYRSRVSRDQLLKDVLEAVVKKMLVEFFNLHVSLMYIPAIREIRNPENSEPDPTELSGINIIHELRTMQVPLIGKESRQKEFHKVETFVGQLVGVDDLKIEIPTEDDDIYLRLHGNRLPLSYYGTGIHELVIICSALAMHHNHVICIEEPEIHLHPSLLRKLLAFLRTTDNRYYITTHSNVFLDADPSVRIYHVSHDEQRSRIERKETHEHARHILNDLAYKASDLLQTNGIIWVEGPSDRIYINRWLQLAGSDFDEGVHYSIMFYGGATLANLSVADGPAEDLVELLRINRHAIVVIDRDNKQPNQKLKKYKTRIQEEIGNGKCWITQGREIENYLRPELLKSYLQEHRPSRVHDFEFNRYDKIQEAIDACVTRGKGLRYDKDKVGHARKIVERMSEDDLDVLDLNKWIKRIVEAIKEWNAG